MEKNTFHKDADGCLAALTWQEHMFPFKKIWGHTNFNQISSISVEQDGFDRIFNTGTLNIDAVTLTGGDVMYYDFRIARVRDPFKAKEELMRASRKYTSVANAN